MYQKICTTEKYQEIYSCNRQRIISCKQQDKTVYEKTVILANCTISTNTDSFLNIVETKVNRNLKKDVCANYNYETEENLLCTCKKVS